MARDTVADAERMLRRAPDARTFVFGAAATHCVLRDAQVIERDETGGGVRLTDRVATIARGTAPGIARNSAVTIGGVAYTVRELLRAENGDLQRLAVVEA